MLLLAQPGNTGVKLNENAGRVVHELLARADLLHVSVTAPPGDACVIDCGVDAPGGLDAGCRMAEVCLAGLARVRVSAGDVAVWSGPWISVATRSSGSRVHGVPVCRVAAELRSVFRHGIRTDASGAWKGAAVRTHRVS